MKQLKEAIGKRVTVELRIRMGGSSQGRAMWRRGRDKTAS